ncbi:MAG: hypothetical protein H2069_03335 [Legionella sp.]|nr:hypothetical protein [Legionella sp.]
MKKLQEGLITSVSSDDAAEDKKRVDNEFYPSIMSGMFFKTLPSSGTSLGVRLPDRFEKGLGFPAIFYGLSDTVLNTVSKIQENLSQIHDFQLKSRKLFEHYDFLMENFIDNEQIFSRFELERNSFNEEYLRYFYLKIKDQSSENKIKILLANQMTVIDLEKILGTYRNICIALQIDYEFFCRETGLGDPSDNKWLNDQFLMQKINHEIECNPLQIQSGKDPSRERLVLTALKKCNVKIYHVPSLLQVFKLTNNNFYKARLAVFQDKIYFPFHYAEEEEFIRNVRNTAERFSIMKDKIGHILKHYQQSGYNAGDHRYPVRYFVDIYRLDYNSVSAAMTKLNLKKEINVLEENKPSTSLSNCL